MELADCSVTSDTVAAAEFVHSRLEGRLVRCYERVYFRDETCLWSTGDKEILAASNDSLQWGAALTR